MTEPEGRDVPVLSTLANGVDVLEALAGGRFSVRQLSERLALNRQTVYRLLRTLADRGWVERDADDTYALTTKVWGVAARSFRMADVRDTLAPVVRALAQEHGDTVHLATYEQGEVVYIDKAEGWHPIRSYTVLGGTAPAYCVATGKILLSLRHPAEVDRVLAGPLTAYTDRTIVEPAALRAELAECRAAGYAVNRGEWRAGVAGIAVEVVTGPTGESVALGFSGPQDRILDRADDLLAALRAALATSPFTPASASARPMHQPRQEKEAR